MAGLALLGALAVVPRGGAQRGGRQQSDPGKVPSDVVLYSKRAMDAPAMLKQATFARTPAGGSGQLYPWTFAGMDYADLGKYKNELAGYLEGAKKVA